MTMKEKENMKKKYRGMKAVPVKGLGVRNNTKTYINGSISKKEEKKALQ